MRLLRRSEWVMAAYFAYAAAVANFLPLRPHIAAVTSVLNLTVVAGMFLLAYAHSLRGRRLLGIVRDWWVLPLLLLAYREMGWFAPERHTYELEKSWVLWDKWLLNTAGLKAAIEAAGPVLPSLLEISYSLVYTIPAISLAALYLWGGRERAERFLFPFVLGVLSVYALFPYFPSEPPRTVFPGEDFPAVVTVFRRFNWWLLGGYGIHTSVFPSAHVSAAFAAAFTMFRVLPRPRWVSRFLLALAILIATATVYGRYHYAVDAVAGLAMSLLAFWLAAPKRAGG